MSISPLAGDIKMAADPTLMSMYKKINELVGASNDDFKSVYKLQGEIAALQKELKDIKMRMMNFG